jgi:N-acyl-D-aspartate/D-glutamate deacylase
MAVISEENKWMEGKTFPEIGEILKKSPMDAMCDLLIEENGKVLVFHAPTKPDDAFTFRSIWKGFTHPLSVPATDAILFPLGRPSHVFYDCFPRFIEFFAKKKNMISLETAIKKCTSMPADIIRIKKRGRIENGNYADILIFDMESLGTSADFYNPRVYPTGIETVIVNGEIVLKEGCLQKNVLAGSIIKSNDS